MTATGARLLFLAAFVGLEVLPVWGDGCDDNWKEFNGNCYYLSEGWGNRGYWDTARRECQRRGGDLAVIPDSATNGFLGTFGKLGYFWIGLIDPQGRDNFTWVDGQNLYYTNWREDAPHGQNCVFILMDGTSPWHLHWFDAFCKGVLDYICQRQPNTNGCTSNPCQHGVCEDAGDGFTCECFPGYEGVLCEIDTDECDSNPCLNGATCVEGINEFFCRCPAGFSGLLCENNIDECDGDPCLNGATCVDGSNEFFCECPAGFSGLLCENNDNIYECPDGHIISKKKTCDLIVDCVDASDELYCDDHFFKCSDGHRIPKKLTCNRIVDCADAGDEIHCDL